MVNYEYLDVMGLTLVKGRFYDREFGSDETNSVVVNETLAREMQWGDSALGKQFIIGVNIQGADNPVGEIIGVVRDFNYGSLHNPVQSLVLICRDNASFMRTLSVRVKEGQMQEVLGWIETQRMAFNPAYPLVRKTRSLQVRDISTRLLFPDIFFDNLKWSTSTGGYEITREP